MTRPDDIPLDVWVAAHECEKQISENNGNWNCEVIARAIMAERERNYTGVVFFQNRYFFVNAGQQVMEWTGQDFETLTTD